MCMGAVSGQGEGRRTVTDPHPYLPREELLEKLGRLQTQNDQFRVVVQSLRETRENLTADRDRLRAEVDRLNRLVEDLNDAMDEQKDRSGAILSRLAKKENEAERFEAENASLRDTIDGLQRPDRGAIPVRRMTFEDLARRVERLEERMALGGRMPTVTKRAEPIPYRPEEWTG